LQVDFPRTAQHVVHCEALSRWAWGARAFAKPASAGEGKVAQLPVRRWAFFLANPTPAGYVNAC
jgi:hypothetical protein